jgi:surfeit locus 1 family protein
MVSRRWIITTIIVIIGSLVCVRLGIWQLDRLAQRRVFNAHYRQTSTLPALEIKSSPAEDLTDMEYRPVIASGIYDFEHQMVLRNQVYENQSGYHLLTPLILSDGTAILIDRGWIPSDDNPSDWRAYDQPGTVTVKGILRYGQATPEIGGVVDATLAPGESYRSKWSLVNIEQISQQLPYKLLSVYIQPDPDPSLTEPPYPYQPEVLITEGSHFGYVLTWFLFAALLFFGYPFFYLPRQVKTEEK